MVILVSVIQSIWGTLTNLNLIERKVNMEEPLGIEALKGIGEVLCRLRIMKLTMHELIRQQPPPHNIRSECDLQNILDYMTEVEEHLKFVVKKIFLIFVRVKTKSQRKNCT